MSCSDVQTIKAGDGSKTQFSFDFPYIFKSEIHVYFWNATTKEYDEKLTTDSTYPWRITDANPTIVEFTSTAPPAPATPVDPGESAVDNVKIRRITKVDDIRALFNPGSAIRSDDLNKNFEQLRYAIQESNCQGIPDDVDQYLKDYYWDRYDNTLYDGDTWVSDDTKIATTAALDARFQDEVNDTFTKAELAAASNIMPNDDVAVPTTGALNDYIDEVITNDIGSSDGVTITDDGDGTITVGLANNSVDFDKIKDADQIQLADQIADPDAEGTDNNIFTAKAATRRFNNYYQNEAPTATDGIGEGQVWVDPNDDLTLSVWSGNAWVGITSGGTFTNQPKVVYVDASSGDDSNDGHRISRPKQSIKAAITQINADDTHGNGSIVVVAPGVYQEACPIQIQKRDVAIVGTSVRNCVVHPTPATETATMFEVNSGTYLKNLTFTGMKASGTRGDSGSLWENATYGLPPTQGWNVAFYDDAMIYKSPYVQNCTNFSDSEIDNSDLDFYAGDENKGRAGDLDSAPTGGGLLIDGSTPHIDSPLRSIVCDSYTHTGLDAPGIFVTNNGYCQATSSYAFFNHAHITCINGGQANLAASTSDFGRYGLIASGKSTSAIFTSTIDGAVSDGAISFNIDAPTAASGWHGSATRPAGNMLVTVNSVTYPILSATANGSGWTVTISRPNSSNRSENLGVNGAISDGAAVSFFLRSMIASSGHTMEYVGSGTDYRALPGNGGVPNEDNQKIELDNGKIWTAITDQNGKFTVGGNQTDDPFFEVDQQLGFVTIPEGSIAFNLLSDQTPQLGGDLDVNGNTITGLPTTPTSSSEATSKAYVDAQIAGIDEVVEDTTPQLGGNLDVNGNEITSASNGDVTINPDGTGDIVLDANVGIGTSSPTELLHTVKGSGTSRVRFEASAAHSFARLVAGSTSYNSGVEFFSGTTNTANITAEGDGELVVEANGSERMRIDSSGRLLLNNTSARTDFFGSTGLNALLNVEGTNNATRATSFVHNSNDAAQHLFVLGKSRGTSAGSNTVVQSSDSLGGLSFHGADGSKLVEAARVEAQVDGTPGSNDMPGRLVFFTTADGASSITERMRIDSSGNVGIGTSSPSYKLHVAGGSASAARFVVDNSASGITSFVTTNDANADLEHVIYSGKASIGSSVGIPICFHTNGKANERMRIDSSGRLLINNTNGVGDYPLQVTAASNANAIVIVGRSSDDIGELSFYENDRTTILGELQYRQDHLNLRHRVGDIRFATGGVTERMRLDSSGQLILSGNGGSENNSLDLSYNGASGQAQINVDSNGGSTYLTFGTSSSGSLSERMRITSGGSLLIGQTNESFGTNGHIFQSSGATYHIVVSNPVLLLNRQSSDGEIVRIAQDGNTEGTISVSGSTVSYNGGHLARWSQLSAGAARTEILRGSVLSNLDEMCEWGEEDNEQLNRMKVSDVEGDVNVSGVFQAWDDDDDTYDNDFYCAMTGDFIIRIAQGTTVARGDLLMSAGDGTAKPQDDDIVRSKTIAKVTSTTVSTTYSDGSYCVPCVLMAC